MVPSAVEDELRLRSPVLPAGSKWGETTQPPPETCVFPVQLAEADAVLAEENGTAALVVTTGVTFFFFFFFATAGVRLPKASSAASAATPISVILRENPLLPGSHGGDPIACDVMRLGIWSAHPGAQGDPVPAGGGSRMNKGRSRLALFGVLALAVCLSASLLAGSADAKKKKKKKSSNSVTLTKSTPTPIPAGDGTNQVAGVATVSFTVGKKQGKGKVVATNSLMPTYQLDGPGWIPHRHRPEGRRAGRDDRVPGQPFPLLRG